MKFFKSKTFKTYRFSIILLVSVAIGSLVGAVMGKDAVVLKPFGDLFLNLMFTIVVPLVFTSIASAVANMIDMKRLGKIIGHSLLVFTIMSLITAVLMLIVTKLIDPVGSSNIILEAGSEALNVNMLEQIVKTLSVGDFSLLLSKSSIFPLIIFSLLFGFGVSKLGDKASNIKNLLDDLTRVLMQLIKIIMYYAPIGLAAYFAALIGEFGPELIGSYTRSMLIYYPLCIAYFFIAYPIFTYIAGGRDGVKRFFANIFAPSVTALTTQSSLASLPTILKANEDIGVPKDINEVVTPIANNIHRDGSVFAAILKITFLFAVFNKPFVGIDTYLIAIAIGVVSAIVLSGIPGGGFIGEMLIVSLYGFPLEAFPIIAMIGFLVDPPATWLNVTGDAPAAMLVAKLVDGKNWLLKKGD
jgi:Na+/H+-dicarboxylate symporter